MLSLFDTMATLEHCLCVFVVVAVVVSKKARVGVPGTVKASSRTASRRRRRWDVKERDMMMMMTCRDGTRHTLS